MGLFNRTKKPSSAAPKAAPKAEKKTEAATAPKAAPVEKAEKALRDTGAAYKVLLRPLVTEKSTNLAKNGAYAFEVSSSANKIEIKKAVEGLYGVKVEAVRVLRVLGKPIRARASMSRRANWRKAYVTLKPGQTIDVFANA